MPVVGMTPVTAITLMNACMQIDPRSDASREQGAESVGRPKRGAHTAPRQEEERADHRDSSDQAQFLADDREDEVGVGLREPLVLLHRVAPMPTPKMPPDPNA